MALRDRIGGTQPIPQPDSQGMQPAQPAQPEQPDEVSWVMDSIKTFVPKLLESGAGMVGGIGDLNNNAGEVYSYALQMAGMDKEKADTWGLRLGTAMFPGGAMVPDTEEMQGMVPEGIKHEPQTWQGDVTGRIAEQIPYMAAMPGGGTLLNKGASAVGSGFGGWLGREGGERVADYAERNFGMDPSWSPYIEGGFDIAGSVIGSFAPNEIQKRVTPNPMDARRKATADILDRKGVPSTAGQRTGNDDLLVREQDTPRWRDIKQKQQEAYTGGALDEMGMKGETYADPKALKRQRDKLQKEFERLQSFGVKPQTKLFEDLVQVRDEYLATTPNRPLPLITRTIKVLSERGRRGIDIDGEWMKNTGTKLRKARENLRASNPVEAAAIDDLIEVIDDAVEASLPAAEQGKFAEVRKLYRNMITVEEAAAGSTSGQLTPADLTRATKKMETRRGYSRGFGPLNEYSRAGEEILYRTPDSGTTRRASARFGDLGKYTNVPSAIGGGVGYMLGGGWGAGVGAMAGGYVNARLKELTTNPILQEYLANQLAAGWKPGVGAGQRAIAGGAASMKHKEEY